jgi:hypothetical protein
MAVQLWKLSGFNAMPRVLQSRSLHMTDAAGCPAGTTATRVDGTEPFIARGGGGSCSSGCLTEPITASCPTGVEQVS